MSARAADFAPATFAIVLVVIVAAMLAMLPPDPRPATADAAEFSAERAFAHVEAIAREPHPAGSEANQRVRDYLVAQLAELELEASIQHGEHEPLGLQGPDDEEPPPVIPLENVLVRIPGTAGHGCVLVMAHYDSVEEGPGAGDNAVGVAAVLEALRAFDVHRDFRNDLLVLFDDGEEIALLGAKLLAEEHPWGEDVRLVLNFDARGNGGPSILFETGPDNARLIGEFAANAPAPVATSLAAAVYSRMPNDTSFSPFRDRAIPGVNFAFIGGATAYHQAFDTPANVSKASLQHHGENALAMLRVAAELDLTEEANGDAVFFNVLGKRLVHYPMGWNWPIAVATVLCVALVLRKHKLTRSELGRGARRFAVLAVAVGLGTWLTWCVLHLLAGVVYRGAREPTGNLQSATWISIGLLGIACAIAVSGLRRFGEPAVLAAGGAVWWAAGLVLFTLALPGGSYMLSWPLLASMPALWVLLAARDRDGVSVGGLLVSLVSFVPTALVLAPSYYLLFLTGSIRMGRGAAIGAFLLAVGCGVALPQLALMVGRRRLSVPGLAFGFGALILFAGSLAFAAGH